MPKQYAQKSTRSRAASAPSRSKQRWTPEDKRARTAAPKRGERPDWSPREKSPRHDAAARPDRASRVPRERAVAPHRGRPAPAANDRSRPMREERAPRPLVEDVVLERLEAAAISADAVAGVTFGELGLGDNIVRALAALGADTPFPIQAATIPQVIAGRDVLGRGRTGSGKTIAFGAPLVERILRLHKEANPNGGRGRGMGRPPKALILAPTRELAQQIDRTVQPIARSVGLFTIAIVGGVPYFKQVTALHRGVDIVIGTPGRVEDLVEKGELDLADVAITVLDEADHMCDLGFLEPVQRILRMTPAGGQRLLYSATLDSGVAALVAEFLDDPSVHEVAGEDQASSTIEHRVLVIEPRDKRRIVAELAGGEGRTIVFTRTRAFAEELAEELEDAGIRATSLHGDLNQAKRNRNLALLTSGRVSVLVATDVAARGIHVDDVALVVQADAAEDYKTYLHRSGRTGRAGRAGAVVTLVGRRRLRSMQELLGRAEITADVRNAVPGDAVIGELASR